MEVPLSSLPTQAHEESTTMKENSAITLSLLRTAEPTLTTTSLQSVDSPYIPSNFNLSIFPRRQRTLKRALTAEKREFKKLSRRPQKHRRLNNKLILEVNCFVYFYQNYPETGYGTQRKIRNMNFET